MAQEIGPSGLIDTWAATGQILEPDLGKKNVGWQLGEKPWHEYMNWLHNTFGQKLNHLMQYGVPLWNNTNAYLIGAAVQHNGELWRALANNTNSTPTNSNPNWRRLAGVEVVQAINVVFNDTVAQLGETNVQGAIEALKVLIDEIDPQIFDFSSQAENQNGALSNKVVSPLGIRQAMRAAGDAPVFAVRAWGNFNGANMTVRGSGNLTDIFRLGRGRYEVVFATAMQDVNYCVSGSTSQGAGGPGGRIDGFVPHTFTANGFLISTFSTDDTLTDNEIICFQVVR